MPKCYSMICMLKGRQLYTSDLGQQRFGLWAALEYAFVLVKQLEDVLKILLKTICNNTKQDYISLMNISVKDVYVYIYQL